MDFSCHGTSNVAVKSTKKIHKGFEIWQTLFFFHKIGKVNRGRRLCGQILFFEFLRLVLNYQVETLYKKGYLVMRNSEERKKKLQKMFSSCVAVLSILAFFAGKDM